MTIYLDNAATSFPKPESVYRAMDEFARTKMANPGRSGHTMALASEALLDDGRHRLNQMFRGKSPDRFIFTLNCTDSLNMAFKGTLQPGDHVITSDIEHNSINRPLRALELAGVITLTRVNADSGGTIDPEDIRKALTSQTKMVAITHASNVLGTVQPVADVGRICRENNVLFLVDAAQTAGVLPVDVQAMKIDLLAFPGHKGLFGPTGTGVLYVEPNVKIKAWREGGTGGDSTTETQPQVWPYFLEGGTPNTLGISGMIAGIKWIEEYGMKKIYDHEIELTQYLWSKLESIPGIHILGHRDFTRRVGTLSFFSENVPAPDLGVSLDASVQIATRPGLHCAPFAHRASHTFPVGTIRVSPGPFNTKEQIDLLVEAVEGITSI